MQLNAERIDDRVGGRWETVYFEPDFGEQPVTIANVQTFDERNR
ncbi:hypothetical protein [Halobaculum sp. EA56]